MACNFNLVGESHYQGRLRNISMSGRSFTAVLLPEPTNAFDPNAIRVVAEGADTIGYLSKEDAVHYSTRLRSKYSLGTIVSVRAERN